MASLGLLGICVPAAYGGAGLDYVSLGLASEELEYVDTSLRVILSVHVGLNSLTLLAWGTEDQKQRYLVPQAQGRKIATYGLTEPGGRQRCPRHPDHGDPARATGTCSPARRCGSRWPTSPITSWCSPGRTSRRSGSATRPGISAFIVERAFKGFSSGTLTQKWGILAGNTGFFKMDDVEVPVENLVAAKARASRSRCSRWTRAA